MTSLYSSTDSRFTSLYIYNSWFLLLQFKGVTSVFILSIYEEVWDTSLLNCHSITLRKHEKNVLESVQLHKFLKKSFVKITVHRVNILYRYPYISSRIVSINSQVSNFTWIDFEYIFFISCVTGGRNGKEIHIDCEDVYYYALYR